MKQVALITGVSSGIGRETANVLAGHGFRVYGTHRRKEPSSMSPTVTRIPMDVRDDDSIRHAVSQVIEESGRIDVLVNNAGYALFGALEETSIVEARDQFETNFFGVLRVTQHVLPAMRRQHYGRIVNMSSILGLIPGPYTGIYAASKHALEAYTETLDHEVRGFGVRAMLIEPSFAKTAFLDNANTVAKPLDEYNGDRAAAAQAFASQLNKGAHPREIAETVYRAIRSRSPRTRHPVGQARTLSLLRRFVPASLFASSLRKKFGLDTHGETR
jgi:short-subunit dehydrogenase